MKHTLTPYAWFVPVLILMGMAGMLRSQYADIEIPEPELGGSPLRIIENKGQWDEPAKFRIRLMGGDVWLEEKGFTYNLYEISQEEEGEHHHGPHGHIVGGKGRETGHVFRVKLVDANPTPALVPYLKYPEYHNYFKGNDPARWAGNVGLYGMVTYEEVYPGTDMRIYGVNDYMKYEFVLQPGADPDRIGLAFEGIQPEMDGEGNLIFRTGFRTLTEHAPVAYQLIKGKKKKVACAFVLHENKLGYAFPRGYDEEYPLIIDPTLEFSTYTGSFSDNWGFTATYDTAGNAFGGGIQFGGSVGAGYPTTTGSYDNTFNGGQTDVTIAKFNSNGSGLIFSTFLGGADEDQPHSMIVNSEQELIVMGRTLSTNFPVTTNAFQGTNAGDWDIFVTRFNVNGSAILGSTYLGGSAADGVNGDDINSGLYTNTKYNYGDDSRGEVIVDGQNNIYIASPTQSSNFPVSSGAYQTSFGGNQDGVVVKFDPTLANRLWATYLGGSGEDAAYTLKLDDNGSVYVAGGTASNNMFSAGSGYQSNNAGGTTDGFIARLNSAGSVLQAATYLGTEEYDQVFLLEFDRFGNVYVTGQTEGEWPVIDPASGPVYENSGSKQFIVKLSAQLNSVFFSTRFGSPGSAYPNISPTAFLVDRCDNMYIAGWGGGVDPTARNQGNTQGMPLFNPYDGTTDGIDMYIISLDRDAQNLLYGTYLGGTGLNEHLDGGTCRFDKNGILYHAVCAGCGGSSAFPTTPGVFSTQNNSTNCNLAVFKISFDLEGVEADFTPRDENNQPIVALQGCAPLIVNFDNQSFEGATPGTIEYYWDFGDGNTSTNFEPQHVYPDPGTYTVTLVITDSTSCNISDTTFQTVEVAPPPDVDAGPDQTACPGDTVTLQSNTVAVTYSWSPSFFVVGDPTQATVDVRVPSTTQFILTITDSLGCENSDTLIVSTDDALDVDAGADFEICRGGSASLNVTAPGIISWNWTSIPAANISDPTIQSPTVTNLDTSTVFIIEVEDSLGCRGSDTIEVLVFEVFTLEDTFVCDGNSLLLQTSNGVSFAWTPNDGTLSDTSIASPIASPLVSTTYTVTAVSVDGCVSSKDIFVEVKPNPTALAGPDEPICFGEQTQLTGEGGFIYLWSPGASLSDSLAQNPFATPDQTTEYVLTVFDNFGCLDTDTTVITVNPLPTVLASDDQLICEQDTTSISAEGAISYDWIPPASLSDPSSASPSAFPSTTTEYIVFGVDANGCENTDTVVIEVIPKPVTVVEGFNNCVERMVELTASGGETYVWDTGEVDSMISVVPGTPTTYTVTAYVGSCEGFPASITVDDRFGYPEAAFSYNQESAYAPQYIEFFNESTGAISYEWRFGFGEAPSYEPNPTYGYPQAGEYQVLLVATSEGGCSDSTIQIITLDNITIWVPNSFSPNDDGNNDNFYLGQIGIQTLNIQIFSRWGNLVYEADEVDFNWDGRYKGRPVPEGVYVWVVRATGENGIPVQREGTLTLVR